MTAPSIKEALELLPCPFCGGEAERIDVPSVGNDPELGGDPNAGGSCIQCKRCVASTALHFDRKENLYSSWNDRFMAGVAEQSGAGAPETSVRCGAPAALVTLQPEGERREAIARIIDPAAKFDDIEGITWSRFDIQQRELAYQKADAILASGLVQDEAGWQPIDTAPKEWIIGYTSWGQHVGKFHEHVGPCEYVSDHHEFTNIDFDMFPAPTHWKPWPAPLRPIRSARDGGEG